MRGLSEWSWTALTMPARHWKWRMRSAAVRWAIDERAELERPWDLILASSYVPLAELLGLVPSLSRVPSLLFFHENQLAFPVSDRLSQQEQARDLHYGFTQLTSALAATRCGFNSRHNRDSFLSEAERILSKMPAPVPSGWVERIAARSDVIYLPLELADAPPAAHRDDGPPIILWNHRWEHDKRPEAFFDALYALLERGVAFRLVVTGQRFRRAPACFDEARSRLADRIVHWGYAESRADYEALLSRADIAVSTAGHEFFGVSMLEATHFGAFPLVPDRLAYPEIFPEAHRYADDAALVDRLTALLAGQVPLRADRRTITAPYRRAALDALRSTLLSMARHDTHTA